MKLHIPLKVATNLQGYYHIILWYEHNEGHHVIVARNQEAAFSVWKRVFAEHGAEIKEYWLAHTVYPTAKQTKKYEEGLYDIAIREVRWRLGYALKSASVHAGWKKCEELVEEKDYEGMPDHGGCEKCCGGWVHRTLSMDDLLAVMGISEFHDEVFQGFHPLGTASDPAKPIMAVGACFGHHSPGISIGEAEFDYPKRALFYFQGKKVKVPQEFKDYAKGLETIWAAERLKSQAEFKVRQEERNRQEKDKHRALLDKIRAFAEGR